jgi:hypothetical protein
MRPSKNISYIIHAFCIYRVLSAYQCNAEIDPSIDEGKWYAAKMYEAKSGKSAQPSIPTVPTLDWKKFDREKVGYTCILVFYVISISESFMIGQVISYYLYLFINFH